MSSNNNINAVVEKCIGALGCYTPPYLEKSKKSKKV
jgi:hypothetical protein